MLNQKQLIADFIEKNRDPFNQEFFERNEDDIIKELMNVIYSCERQNEYFTIKVESYRVVDDFDEINQALYDYYEGSSKNKSKIRGRDNKYDCIDLNESYIRLLIVNYYVKDRTEEDHIEVIIAVPRIIDKYYFKINGIMRSTLFQIVDGSTYNNATSNAKVPSVTLKIIFMATRVIRYYKFLVTTTGEELKATYYSSKIFNKDVACAKYIFAKFGFYGGLKFFGFDQVISVTREELFNDNLYTFKIGEDYYLNTPKVLFDDNYMLQSVIATLCEAIVPGLPFETVFDNKFWIRSLGADFNGGADTNKILAIINGDETITDTLVKGNNILDSLESIYDISTRESIRLPDSEKETTYHILRWIMREFNALRLKNNLDIGCKKIRFAEYIASLYAFKIAFGIYRVSDMNKRASIASIRKAIRTNPNFLLSAISKSKMVAYRNMVSDMDSMQALKFTYKGVSGLGEGSKESVPEIYRNVQPSHIGKVDLDSSSDTNPGITGTLCPYAPVHNGFFGDYEEPNTWEIEFLKSVDAYKKLNNLKDALIFEEQLLLHNKSDDIKYIGEVMATMKNLITPVIFANEGVMVPFEEAIIVD